MGEIAVNKNKIFIVNRPGNPNFPIPLLWASAKTYYEENSKYSDKWVWGTPDLNYDNSDQLLSFLIDEKPTVVGFSLYVWNETFSLNLAKELKKHLKDIIIVVGGPQADIKYNIDYFKMHTYIDLVIPSDAYGERSIMDILDTISSSDIIPIWDNLQYSYYPDDQRNIKFNCLAPKKREFKWPTNPFRAQESYINSLIANRNDPNPIMLLIETSRGCPYKCSFCDWGGGVFTKTVKKEFATVLDEITWAGQNQIPMISFTDANFGAYDIDVEYTKHLVSVHKKYGFPTYCKIQPSKSKIHNLFKIYTLLSDVNMLSHYQISIQDLDDDVKKNVDRVDFSFEDQISMFHKLQEHKYLPIVIEMILGLPGSSLATVKDSIHKISLAKLVTPIAYFWALLPTTPAYDPAYREKYKIVTVTGKSSYGPNMGTLRAKSINIVNDTTTEFVVGSFSYTKEEWIDMHLVQLFTAATQGTGILNLIADYLWHEHNIKYGEFFNTCIQTLLYDQQIDQKLQHDILLYRNKLLDWLAGLTGDLYIDYSESHPFVLAPSMYYLFVALTQTDEFFKGILISIAKLTLVTDKIIDLCSFSRGRLMDISYNPGRVIHILYDWPGYIKTSKLEYSPTSYALIADTFIYYANEYPITWAHLEFGDDLHERMLKFINLVVADEKSKKTIDQMVTL
jgi:putative methyltransferase